MSASMEERVAAGVAWLEGKDPDPFGGPWWELINLDEFSMENVCGCILGQSFGQSFWSVVEDEFGVAMGVFCEEAAALGFDGAERDEYGAGEEWEFRALEAEWRRVILARRAEAVSAE